MSREEREEQLFQEIGQLRAVIREKDATIQGLANEIAKRDAQTTTCQICSHSAR